MFRRISGAETCAHRGTFSISFRWLQPDSYADPQKTSLILNKDDIRCGWPATVVVQTKDQYGDVVHVPNMKVRVRLSICGTTCCFSQLDPYEGSTPECLCVREFVRCVC